MDSKTKQQTVQMGTGKITVSEITMCGVFAALTFLLTRYIQVQIIPAKKDLVTDAEKKKLRVCAYCRVSTEEDNQASSCDALVVACKYFFYHDLIYLFFQFQHFPL